MNYDRASFGSFGDLRSMKQSFYILSVTGASAIAATLFAWIQGNKQEDVGSAIGGVAGFVFANGIAIFYRGSKYRVALRAENSSESDACELGFAYGVFAIAYFAFVGWLTGYLHDHGDFAGTVCGGLGGYILAVMVPALHQTSFLAARRKQQLAIAVVALGALLRIVWAMYEREFLY
jgi:cyanate permease